ncbi:MAG: hypothetical protein MJ172_01975 [Clostridia bacterium]|nr:hypothetical protein [Clostridia bacterium]
MNRKQIKKLILDAVLILFLSIAVVIGGMVTSTIKRNSREQKSYLSLFNEVLPANKYEKVSSDLLKKFPEINSVYKAVGENNITMGYILDIDYLNAEGLIVHSLVAVSSDGSNFIGYKKMEEEGNSVIYSDSELSVLLDQSLNKTMPIAVTSEEEEEDTDEEDVVVSITGLHDGIYYAQSFTKDNSGFIDYVEIEVNDGIITRVKWDAFNVDRTTKDRSEASLTGAYTVSGENWATQSYNICHALIDYQVPSKLAMKSDGTTDIVPGVTCNIRCFVELAEECIRNARHRFDEELYIETMMEILDDSMPGFRDTCLLTEEGYIVYHFKDMSPLSDPNSEGGFYPTIFDAYIGKTLTPESIEDIIEDDNELLEITTVPVIDTSDPVYYEVGEDGVVRDQQNPVLTLSVDGIALSEFNTFIDGIPGEAERSENFCSSINVAYKFMKEYFNWMS